MRDRPSAPSALSRRGVLRALALAPAALAGCAGAGAERPRPATGAPVPAPAQPPTPPVSPAALAAIRSAPLAADAEPAFFFRAAASRPGEPR